MRVLADEYMVSDEQIFVILAVWESDSCLVVKSSIPGQLVSFQPLLDFLKKWKWIITFVRPSDQVYLAFIELLFSDLAAWNCDI
jgi:hypothetical protein